MRRIVAYTQDRRPIWSDNTPAEAVSSRLGGELVVSQWDEAQRRRDRELRVEADRRQRLAAPVTASPATEGSGG